MRTSPLERPVAPAATNCLSRTNGLSPRCARWNARLAPCTPAPMIMTSAVVVMSLYLGGDHSLGARCPQAFLDGAHEPARGHRVHQRDHVAAAPPAAQLGPQGASASGGLHQAIELCRGNRHALEQC